ncbi:M48 family metalloprotease [Polaromonas sp. P1-6]|nr:M48 family metalloprotease [Polaromonas sp. P1-6]
MPGGSTGSLPHLGDNSELTAAAERRLGDRIAVSIYHDPDNIDDPVLADYLQSIWQPLMAAARARGELAAELDERFAWEIFLIRDRTINAFALPGGYFGVHLGLIGTVGSSDELAAVLAHELSHVTQRHISRLMTNQSRQTPWILAAMILGALAAGKSGDMASAAVVGGQALAAQGQLNFSRDMEREADRVGFGVMTDAGFQSRGVTAMFDKLQQGSRLNDNGAFPYLRSHPLTTERIAEAQARLQLVPAANPAKDSDADAGKARLLHAMMAARARAVAAPGVDVLRTMVAEAQRRAGPAQLQPLESPASAVSATNIHDAGTLYGGALAAAQLRDFAGARNLLARLKPLTAEIQRANNAVELLSIEIDLLAGAVPPSASSIDITKATSRADVMVRARALLAAGRAKEVSERLQTWVAAHPKDASAWQLLAVAYGKQNQNVRAIRADAESRAAQLDYPAALDRLKAAQGLMRSNPGSADYVEGSIIDTRTRQVELLVKEQALQDKIDR